MLDFIWRYLIGPIFAEARGEPVVWNGVEALAGYNIYNTVAWGALAIIGVYTVLKLFERYEINFNPLKALKLLPLIFLGGVLRAVQDAADLPLTLEILLITPVIYIWIAALAVVALLLQRLEYLDMRYFNTTVISAILLALVFLRPPLTPLSLVLLGSALIGAGFYYGSRDTDFSGSPVATAVASQFFEAFSSIYGLLQGYNPRQLLTSIAVDSFGPLGFLLVKIGVLAVFLWVYRDLEEAWEGVILVALYSIGFATGVRVLLRASMGV